MANYQLSNDAKEDLKRIYRWGILNFGEAQADAYFAALFERFDDIAAAPHRFQSVDHIREGYRRSVCGVDSIYYRVENGTVEIMAILGRQDNDRWL